VYKKICSNCVDVNEEAAIRIVRQWTAEVSANTELLFNVDQIEEVSCSSEDESCRHLRSSH